MSGCSRKALAAVLATGMGGQLVRLRAAPRRPGHLSGAAQGRRYLCRARARTFRPGTKRTVMTRISRPCAGISAWSCWTASCRIVGGRKRYFTDDQDWKVTRFLTDCEALFCPVSFGRYELEEQADAGCLALC